MYKAVEAQCYQTNGYPVGWSLEPIAVSENKERLAHWMRLEAHLEQIVLVMLDPAGKAIEWQDGCGPARPL